MPYSNDNSYVLTYEFPKIANYDESKYKSAVLKQRLDVGSPEPNQTNHTS